MLATVVTGANGTFGYMTTPKQYTTYLAKWSSTTSAPILAQVAPKLTLMPGRNGYMKAQVTAGRSFFAPACLPAAAVELRPVGQRRRR